MNSALTIELIEIILITSSYSALIPLSLSVFGWKRLSFDLKILSAYLLLSLIIDLFTSYFAHRSVNNLFLLYLLAFLEFIIFSYLYHRFFNASILKQLVLWIGVLFTIFIVLHVIIEGMQNYATLPRTVECFIFTSYAIVFLFYVLKGNQNVASRSESIFWFNGAVLVYFAGTLLFNSLSTYILENTDIELQKKLFTTPSILNIIQKILFTVSIWFSIVKR